MPKSRKERTEGKKKKPWQMSKERRKQLIAIFIVLLFIGSALVLMVTY